MEKLLKIISVKLIIADLVVGLVVTLDFEKAIVIPLEEGLIIVVVDYAAHHDRRFRPATHPGLPEPV